MTNPNKLADALITHDQAAEAVDSMDDYAKMDVSVDPFGPRATLERYIAQQRAASPQPSLPDGVELSDHAIAQAAHNCGFDIEFGDADEIEAPRWITEDGGDGFADLRKFAVAIAALAQQRVPDAVRDAVDKALQRTWSLGQAYADQANSEFMSRNRKSVKTLEAFRALVAETLATIDSQNQNTQQEARGNGE